MRRLLLSALAMLLLLDMASAGIVSRSTKPNGTTSWVDGDTITASALNGDPDNIYNEFNGNIDNDNLKSAAGIVGSKLANGTLTDTQVSATAAIQPSKLDDHADTDANFREVESPGRTGSLRKPTDLEGELERLRFALKEIKVGLAIDNDSLNWMDQPHRGGNLIYNGSFEATDGGGNDSSTSAPAGWSATNTPTLAYGATDVSDGDGLELQITAAGGADEGVSQTLSGLKASTSYLAVARVKRSSGSNNCELKTSGGDTDASVTSDATSYATIADVFATNTTPTDIVLTIEVDTDTEQCDWDHVGVYELNEDPVPAPGVLVFRDTGDSDDDDCDDSYTTGCTNLAAVEVRAPGPNYIAYIRAWATLDTAAVNLQHCLVRIFDGSSTLREAAAVCRVEDPVTVNVTHVATTPMTPGTAVTFRVDARESASASAACRTESTLDGGGTLSDPHGIEVVLMPGAQG